MVYSNIIEKNSTLRFVDFGALPKQILALIEGYEQVPLVTLEEAVKPLVKIVSRVERNVKVMKENCQELEGGLTIDESASIMLYTYESMQHEDSLHVKLNETLRSEQQGHLNPWFPYLRLILTALARLSSQRFHLLRESSIDIHPNARWQQNGIIVAEGNEYGNGINQLYNPRIFYVDDDQTIYVADSSNHRIVEWKWGMIHGQVVASGNEKGSGTHQLSYPQDVIVDKESDSLIICDNSKRRVVRWSRRNGTRGAPIISNISCWSLTIDKNEFLCVVDNGKHEVRRYRRGESQKTVVADGNGKGNRLDQLSYPHYEFIDRDHSVYVSECENDHVMIWVEGAKQGIVISGGQGQENNLTQLEHPRGVVVDQLGTVYVADHANHRIMHWHEGIT
ncbi:unnamed protein product [Rotaria sp. Silwood1]|nr:unnamed protein product [Rotaria sp. Silwood1]